MDTQQNVNNEAAGNAAIPNVPSIYALTCPK